MSQRSSEFPLAETAQEVEPLHLQLDGLELEIDRLETALEGPGTEEEEAEARADLVKLYAEHARLQSLGARVATAKDLGRLLPSISWLWPSWLPRGFITLLAAATGVGKSAVALWIARCLITPTHWPDGSPGPQESDPVLWIDTESSQALLWDRIERWGLDGSKMLLPSSDPVADVRLDNRKTMKSIERIVDAYAPQLIVVDSLRGAHSFDENDSRMVTMLQELARIARDCDIAVLCVHHLRKKAPFENDHITLDRLRGSSVISQMARVIWTLESPDPIQPQVLRLRALKSNLALLPEPIGLQIAGDGLSFGLAPEDAKQQGPVEHAIHFLLAELETGPRPAHKIYQNAEGQGISKYALRQGKDRLKVVAIRKPDAWVWALPTHQERENTHPPYRNSSIPSVSSTSLVSSERTEESEDAACGGRIC